MQIDEENEAKEHHDTFTSYRLCTMRVSYKKTLGNCGSLETFDLYYNSTNANSYWTVYENGV
jgi:hypothetical protein